MDIYSRFYPPDAIGYWLECQLYKQRFLRYPYHNSHYSKMIPNMTLLEYLNWEANRSLGKSPDPGLVKTAAITERMARKEKLASLSDEEKPERAPHPFVLSESTEVGGGRKKVKKASKRRRIVEQYEEDSEDEGKENHLPAKQSKLD